MALTVNVQPGSIQETLLLKEIAKLKLTVGQTALKEWVENKEFSKLWDKHVPSSGEAKTEYGEAIRAIGRLEYDYYNNGFGNAVEISYEPNYYGDEEDEKEVRSAKPYYLDMWKKLDKYLRGKKADANILKAAKEISPAYAEPWDHKPDPKFKQAVTTLKDWFVANKED